MCDGHIFECTTPSGLPPRRAFSSLSDFPGDLFNYTSGRWLQYSRIFSVNNDLRLAERQREFDVDELCRLAAQSVGRSLRDIDTFVKLAEGGFNRTFLISSRWWFASPTPVTVPKFYAIASEVATMRFLRSSGLPIPEVYDYSPSSDNAARTEYIFMEFVRGTKLSDIWTDFEKSDIVSVLRRFAQLESQMMSIPFLAGGSLYYTGDLENVAGMTGIPLNDERFCVDENIEAVLLAAARKELAYLEQFEESYEYKKQSSSDHIKNLERYLLIVSTSSDSNQLKIVGVLNWKHASILPQFLLANIPGRLQNYDDPVSQALIPPSLPANIDELDQSKQCHIMGLSCSRLVHFHYLKNSEEYSKLHHDAMSDLACMLTGEGGPYPIMFEPEDLRETKELSAKLQEADEIFERDLGAQ
ncbi:hypothetical protein J3R30DRAFT_3672693 [Lentinula aciculospora]|uniref:Aminoglycoside phosphotransferase domain-containing protein n=1 Tax=Lentinula aciculospora TaxID=153920 RepID=A0A9W9A0N5_9AGAR|nr:hypothetical protein J3R30DRAFT_3672693 [Lentinula aciculospora]